MDNVFVDTNIWIYALIREKGNQSKHIKSLELFENLQSSSRIIISVQIINEFHWVLSRKYKISDHDIIMQVKESISKISQIVPINFDTYLDSAVIREKYKLSFWDSLIVTSAIQNNCTTLYSEDLTHNQLFEKKLKVSNPFDDKL